MTRNFSRAKAKDRERLQNNVLLQPAKGVLLKCGHYTERQPMVSSPKKSWWCEPCRKIMTAKG